MKNQYGLKHVGSFMRYVRAQRGVVTSHSHQREDAFQEAERANRRCGEYATQTRERGPLLPAALLHGVHDVLQTNGLHGRDPLTI
jgi:hypothetical protein